MSEQPTTTDIVLRGGRVGLGGTPGDVVVADGVVRAVGPTGTVEVPAAAEVVELGDATVLPGLVDGHVHVEQWARRSRRVDVAGSGSPDEVARRLRDGAGEGPDGWVIGHGFIDGLWSEPAHKQVLDAIVGPVPVAVVSGDLHTVWLSSAGLATIDRHHGLGVADHPTGVLREHQAMDVIAAMEAADPVEVVDGWVQQALAGLPERGVTGLIDFEFTDTVAAWPRRSAVAPSTVRVQAAIWPEWLDAAIEAGHRTGAVVEGTGGRVTVGPLKVLADGSLNTRTAWCADPYPGACGHDSHGLRLIEPDELVGLMARGWRAGLHPAVHAIGDMTNAMVLDAFEEVGCPGRIEHAQMVRADDFVRFARPGLVASVQPQHAVADRSVADRQWEGRTDRSFPYRSLYEAGARLELGSDAPVSPLDPWLAIADAVARTDDDRPPWHPEQTLPLAVAVVAASAGRAAISVGDPADLTVVPGDLTAATPADLRAMEVLATLVGGEVTHRAR